MSAKLGRAKGPLRKVLRAEKYSPAPGALVPRDVLECLHTLPPAQDIYGARYPARRRCWKCEAGKPAEVEQ